MRPIIGMCRGARRHGRVDPPDDSDSSAVQRAPAPPEERERKFREFVKFVIENYELSGHPLPADHPLREWLPGAEAA